MSIINEGRVNTYTGHDIAEINNKSYEFHLTLSVSSDKKKMNRFFKQVNSTCINIVSLIKDEKDFKGVVEDEDVPLRTYFNIMTKILYNKIKKDNDFCFKVEVIPFVNYGNNIIGYSSTPLLKVLFARKLNMPDTQDRQLSDRSYKLYLKESSGPRGPMDAALTIDHSSGIDYF